MESSATFALALALDPAGDGREQREGYGERRENRERRRPNCLQDIRYLPVVGGLFHDVVEEGVLQSLSLLSRPAASLLPVIRRDGEPVERGVAGDADQQRDDSDDEVAEGGPVCGVLFASLLLGVLIVVPLAVVVVGCDGQGREYAAQTHNDPRQTLSRHERLRTYRGEYSGEAKHAPGHQGGADSDDGEGEAGEVEEEVLGYY
mmetsp:Transcript_460/g.835  ORF Transcript_460/g.835 Transcript_460/m.835 type:complete len:204 (-) Transcript_460:558-1169(-)